MSTRKISAEEYVTHSNAKDRWVAVNGVIYDFTKFNHPGGNHIITMYVGADGSTRFNDHHNDNRLERTAGTKGLIRIGVQGWERDSQLGRIMNPLASRRSERIRNIPKKVDFERTIPMAKVVKNETETFTPRAPKTPPRKPKTPELVTPGPLSAPRTPKAPKKPSKPATKPKVLETIKPMKRSTTKKAPAAPATKAPAKKRKRDEQEEEEEAIPVNKAPAKKLLVQKVPAKKAPAKKAPAKKVPAKKAAVKKALTKKRKHHEEDSKDGDVFDPETYYIVG